MTNNRSHRLDRPPDRIPKLCGGDVEFGNFLQGPETTANTDGIASQLLLGNIAGLPNRPSSRNHCNCTSCRQQRELVSDSDRPDAPSGNENGTALNLQDVGRKFLLENGGCAYIDLNHLQLCVPNVRSARDHVAASRAMMKLAQNSMLDLNRRLPPGRRIQVLANNSDGQGNSYGSHLNVLVSRQAWENIFHRRVHYSLYLATFQVASVVLTGQGKVGSENDAPAVDYQLSQRADFFETLVGLQTTHYRPIVNSRDEPLTGSSGYGRSSSGDRPGARRARLHVIFYDNNLCQVAALLKIGLLQIVAAMIEAESVSTSLFLEDPVDAVVRYSHDPTLQAAAPLVSGTSISAVDLMRRLLDDMQGFVERGGCDGIVPDARDILALADDTLQKLADRDFDSLAGRLDWVLKGMILTRAMERHAGLTWQSPQLKHLDHLYSSLDPQEGLFWAYEQDGRVEQVVTDEHIDRLTHEPPADTRAYARAMLLRRARPPQVTHVDWDEIEFRKLAADGWPSACRLDMADPLAFTEAEVGGLFQDPALAFDEILDELMLYSQQGESRCSSDNRSTTHLNGPPSLSPATIPRERRGPTRKTRPTGY